MSSVQIKQGIIAGKTSDTLSETRRALVAMEAWPQRLYVAKRHARYRDVQEWIDRIECWGFVAKQTPDYSRCAQGMVTGFAITILGAVKGR